MELHVGSRLSVEIGKTASVAVPDALAAFHRASDVERKRRVRSVLVRAWTEYRRGGVSLVGAVRGAGGGAVECEYALRELRCVLLHLDLASWEAHPARVRADVHRLFRVAIGRLTPHRGGWQVASARAAP